MIDRPDSVSGALNCRDPVVRTEHSSCEDTLGDTALADFGVQDKKVVSGVQPRQIVGAFVGVGTWEAEWAALIIVSSLP